MIMELVGAIGAGKSTLAGPLHAWLVEHGYEGLSPAEGISRCLARSPVWGPLLRMLPQWLAGGIAQRAVLRIVHGFALLSFALRYPRLTWRALRLAGRLPLPSWHRHIIRRLFFQIAAEYQFLHGRLRADEVVVFEEGFFQRAVNLFAWRHGEVDEPSLRAYFTRLPVTELVVLVKAPAELCAERSRRRGLPRRLSGQDGATVSRLLANSAAIAVLAGDYLATSRRPHLVVDNGGALDAAATALRAGLELLPAKEMAHPSPSAATTAVTDGR